MAKSNRSFSPSDVPQKKEDYHGNCRVYRLSPDIASRGIQSVNINLSFEEALRLSTAIQSAILALNRNNRSAKAGKEMGVCLSLKGNALAVMESKLVPPKKSATNDGQV
jgi:hypothetical protein